MMRRAMIIAGVIGLLVHHAAPAQMAPIAGVDYRMIRAASQVSSSTSVIEVVEFFWYRCPHCYAIEPLLETWTARLPANVRFRRVPVVFGDEWAIDARVFYALDALGELERLHVPLIRAVHEQGGKGLRRGDYLKWVETWLASQGIDVSRYQAAFDSREVREQVANAERLTRVYGIEGTPNLAVGGRYLIPPQPGDRRRILVIADQLIDQLAAPARQVNP